MKKEEICVRTDSVCTVWRTETDVPMQEYLAGCVNVGYFLEMCKACPNYNSRWSCPSFDFDPMEIWSRYSRLHLVAYRLVPQPGQTVQAMLDAHSAEKVRMVEELTQMEAAVPGSLALWAGTCGLCARRARADGAPCRRPTEMRHSIEALGGDVGKTAERYLGRPVLWIRGQTLPEYLMLIGGLLCGE